MLDVATIKFVRNATTKIQRAGYTVPGRSMTFHLELAPGQTPKKLGVAMYAVKRLRYLYPKAELDLVDFEVLDS